MTTTVVHCKRDRYDVYIGRPSIWGNPFTHITGKTLAQFVVPYEEVLPRYEAWLREQLRAQPHMMAALRELRGKVLGCWCKPRPCHGDVIARLADEIG